MYRLLREYKKQKVQTCVLPQSTLRVHCAQSRTHFCSLYFLNGQFIPRLFICWVIGFLCFFSMSAYANSPRNICSTSILDNYNCCNEQARQFKSNWPTINHHHDMCSCDEMEKEVRLNTEADDGSLSAEQLNDIIIKAYSNLKNCVQIAERNQGLDAQHEVRSVSATDTNINEQCHTSCYDYANAVKQKCLIVAPELRQKCSQQICNKEFVNELDTLSKEHKTSIESRMRDEFKQVLDPIARRCEVKKEKCAQFCKSYARRTSQGCSSQSGNLVSACDRLCDEKTVFDNFLVEGEAEYDGGRMEMGDEITIKTYIEREWTNIREHCIEEAKEVYVTAYVGKCGEKIKKIAEGQGKTILCAEKATKQNPQCKEYCNSRASELYITAQKAVGKGENEFIATMSTMGLNSSDENISMVYRSLVAKDMGRLVQDEMEKLEIIDDDNKLVPPLSWWLCEKGKNQACEADLYRALEEAEKVCSDLQKEARECCHQPEQCVGGGLAASLDSLGKLNVTIAGMKGQKRMCEAVQQTSGMYAGMQGAMAAQCMNKANACSQGCNQEVEKVAEVFRETCNHDPRSKGGHNESEHSCDKKLFSHYMKMYKGYMSVDEVKIGEVSEECQKTGQESNRRIQDMNTHLGSSLLAGMKECGQKPKEWKPTPPPEGCPPNCPPPVPTCPPNCPGPPPTPPPVEPPGGGGGGGPSEVADPFADAPLPQAANPFGEDPDLGEGAPDMGKGVKKGMSGLIGGGGGTGGGGLGGLGSGGPSGGRDRGGKAPARKKKVLLGFKGGKFTGYGGGASNSGEERSRRRASRSGKKRRGVAALDLKKLLPKGKQLNNKVGKFGSPHDNIFQRMSDRIQWMCRTEQISCK